MKKTFLLFVGLLLLVVWGHSSPAHGAKIRYLASVYGDRQGAGLKYPEGVACTENLLFVADTGNSRVVRYSYEGRVVTGQAEYALPNTSPIKLEVDSRGYLYVLDGRERRIILLGTEGNVEGYFSPKGVPGGGQVVPRSFAVGHDDSVYLLDVFSRSLLVLDRTGQYQRQLPFPGDIGFFSDVAVDRQGTVYLLDSVAAAVYVVPANVGEISLLSSNLREYVNFPTNMTVDRHGVLYLVDQHGGGLALLNKDGSFLGRKLSMGWNESQLSYPAQICISGGGSIFIADRNNSRVQLFSLEEK
ncbi:MAG: NHL repeat-containing protein [Deltaproteobacteria bacterium]|nr:NHL repeat-containing protein [Candidatus Anaeroferrophillus wilburensis]MBN2888006.1 NHL repeat-containing protein [Deltaproteobacteria bacterium]